MPDVYPQNEAEYQAHDDARSLIRAEVVKADPARLKAAKAWAKKLLAAENAEQKAMESVAKG